jgi:hypothetical protein
MSFETSKKQIVEAEGLPQSISVQQDQQVPGEGKLAPGPDPENTHDPESLGRLRGLFELLDEWDQEEKTDEK